MKNFKGVNNNNNNNNNRISRNCFIFWKLIFLLIVKNFWLYLKWILFNCQNYFQPNYFEITKDLFKFTTQNSTSLFFNRWKILTWYCLNGLDSFCRHLSKPLNSIFSVLITIGITDNSKFHSFLDSLVESKYLSLFLFSSIFTLINNNNNNYYYYHYYHYYYYCSLIRAFHISNSRWFFTEVWVTAGLSKSPGLFLVFWQFSTMLSFGWSPLVRQTPSPLVPLVIP